MLLVLLKVLLSPPREGSEALPGPVLGTMAFFRWKVLLVPCQSALRFDCWDSKL